MALDAVDHVERVRQAHAARDDLLGGGEQRRARHLEVAVAQRDEHAELLALALERVVAVAELEPFAELLRGDDLGRLGRLAGGALEREQALAGVARAGA